MAEANKVEKRASAVVVERVEGNLRSDERLRAIHDKLVRRRGGGVVERLFLTRRDATKNRLRTSSDLGSEVIIDVPRGTKIRHGDVLSYDGTRMLLAEWVPEDTMIITIVPPETAQWEEKHLELAARLGHISGIKHYPIFVTGKENVVPIEEGSSREQITKSFSSLQGINIRFEKRILADEERALEVSGHESHAD